MYKLSDYPELEDKIVDILSSVSTIEIDKADLKVLVGEIKYSEAGILNEISLQHISEYTGVDIISIHSIASSILTPDLVEKEKVKFGNYILSDIRNDSVSDINKQNVTDADLANSKELNESQISYSDLPVDSRRYLSNNIKKIGDTFVVDGPNGESVQATAISNVGKIYAADSTKFNFDLKVLENNKTLILEKTEDITSLEEFEKRIKEIDPEWTEVTQSPDLTLYKSKDKLKLYGQWWNLADYGQLIITESIKLNELKELPKEYKNGGLTFTQVERTGKAAIYKSDDDTYEVFLINIGKPTQIKTNGKVLDVPEREKIPSNNDFGSSAWAYTRKEQAFTKYNSIKEALHKIKRQWTEKYPAIHINPDAQMRNKIIEFVGSKALECSYEDYREYCKKMSEDSTIKKSPNPSYLSHNKHILKMVESGGKKFVRLTELGKRIFTHLKGNKSTLNESIDFSDLKSFLLNVEQKNKPFVDLKITDKEFTLSNGRSKIMGSMSSSGDVVLKSIESGRVVSNSSISDINDLKPLISKLYGFSIKEDKITYKDKEYEILKTDRDAEYIDVDGEKVYVSTIKKSDNTQNNDKPTDDKPTNSISDEEIENKLKGELDSVISDLEGAVSSASNKDANEAIGVLAISIAVAAPKIASILSSFAKKVGTMFGKDVDTSKIEHTAHKLHDFYIDTLMKGIKPFVKDEAKAKSFANLTYHIIVASLLYASGASTIEAIGHGSVGHGIIEGALTAIKSGELKEFIATHLKSVLSESLNIDYPEDKFIGNFYQHPNNFGPDGVSESTDDDKLKISQWITNNNSVGSEISVDDISDDISKFFNDELKSYMDKYKNYLISKNSIGNDFDPDKLEDGQEYTDFIDICDKSLKMI